MTSHRFIKHGLMVFSAASLGLASQSMGAVKIIQSCDFSASQGFTAGTLVTSTQYTNGTAGQGGWYAAGGGSAFYNIVNDPVAGGSRGQGLSIQGSSTGTSRWAWTNAVADNWGSRDADSDTIYAVWDQDTSTFTSSTTAVASVNRFGAVIYDTSGTKILAGMYMQASNGRLYGLSYAVNGTSAAANIAYSITSGSSNVTLTRDAWHSFAITFNKTTGRTNWYWKSSGSSTWSTAGVNGAAAGSDPDEFDFYQSDNGAGAQGKAYMDNLTVYSGTGSFVPGPGSVALLGVAGLIGTRRRR